MAKWCEEQLNETRDALLNIELSPLNDLASICMKNSDGKFGMIFREDIDNNHWLIMDAYKDTKTYLYNSCQQMVDAGWIVD